MSLRNKIVLSFICCIIFAFTPLIYILNTTVKDLNMQQSQEHTIAIIESKAVEISSWLNQRISEIRILEQHPDCRNVNVEALKPYISNLNKILQKKYGNVAETFAIGGTDGQGWINDDITIDVSKRDYFKEAMKTDKEYVISEPVISKSDNNPIFLICYPIRNENGITGFINGSVNLNKISEIVSTIDIYNGNSWIMDKKGNIYSSKTNTFVSQNLDEHLVKQINQQIGDNYSGKVDFKDQSISLFYSSIPLTDNWILCTAIENDVIYSQTNFIINMIFMVCLLMLVLTVLLSIQISRTITEPIDKLKMTMDKLSSGDLDCKFEYNGKDEVSSLGKTFNNMVCQIKSLLNEVVLVQSQKRIAELKTLQSQINPHFLYNTLDTLQWKALEKDAFEVADIVNSLSRFFRISLSDGKELITVSDEIQHVKSYLEIQKIRYKDKMDYEITVDKEIEQYLIPKLIIQPLVENSIYHGIKPKGLRGTIFISVEKANDFLTICVEDNGCGIDNETLKSIQTNLSNSIKTDNYGLYNVNERLNLWFAYKSDLHIESEENVGTKVRIQIPFCKEGSGC